MLNFLTLFKELPLVVFNWCDIINKLLTIPDLILIVAQINH